MNVKVTIELSSSPKRKDHEEMYYAAKYLTNNPDSIYIYQPRSKNDELTAEFTTDKARQIDVVDKIAKEFSYNVSNYDQISISFPHKPTKKRKPK